MIITGPGFRKTYYCLAASQKTACGKLASSPFSEAGISCVCSWQFSRKNCFGKVQIFAFTYLYRLLWAPVINFVRLLCLEERGAFCLTTRSVFFFWGGAKHARTARTQASKQASKQAIYLSEMVTFCAYRTNDVWWMRNASLVFVRLIRSLRFWLLFLACSRQGFCILRWKLVLGREGKGRDR